MKYAAAILAAAGLVAAQDFTGQPECAIPCLEEFIPQVGCSLTDTACQCNQEKQNELRGKITTCLLNACGTDALKAAEAASSVCAAFSATATGAVSVTGLSSLSEAPTVGLTVTGPGTVDVTSLIASLTEDASSALETGSESLTSSASGDDSETESQSVVVSTVTSDGTTFVQTSTPSDNEEGAASTSSTDAGAMATGAPIAGMAIAAIIAAAL